MFCADSGSAIFPALHVFLRAHDGSRPELHRRRPAVAQIGRAVEELDELLPLRRRTKLLVLLRRAVAVAAHAKARDHLLLERFLEVVPVDPLRVGADLDHRGLPALPGDLRDDRGELLVQERLAVIEEPERMDALDVDVAQAQGEVLDGNALDLRLERGVRTTDTAQLAAVDDVEMQRIDLLRWCAAH
jgi:hypothetical protein